MDFLMKTKELFQERLLNIPNLLTIMRLLLLFPFLYIAYLYGQDPDASSYFVLLSMSRKTILIWLLGLLVLAGFTDFLDGLLARRLGQTTKFGRYLDPICDKIYSVSIFSLLTLYFSFPLWIYISYLVREALTFIFASILYFKHSIQVKPNAWGKLSVFVGFITIAWYICYPVLKNNELSLFPGYYWLLDLQPLAYLWFFSIAISSLYYSRVYGKIVFSK